MHLLSMDLEYCKCSKVSLVKVMLVPYKYFGKTYFLKEQATENMLLQPVSDNNNNKSHVLKIENAILYKHFKHTFR